MAAWVAWIVDGKFGCAPRTYVNCTQKSLAAWSAPFLIAPQNGSVVGCPIRSTFVCGTPDAQADPAAPAVVLGFDPFEQPVATITAATKSATKDPALLSTLTSSMWIPRQDARGIAYTAGRLHSAQSRMKCQPRL